MLNVFFTTDVEVWCDGWKDIDRKFSNAFKTYIYGHTAKGNYGLPFQVRILNDYGLKGVFFVEPLFAGRFGIAPLEEIVGMIKAEGQEVQMHMHPEWVDESREPMLPNISGKRQHMKHYSLEEQILLVKTGIDLLDTAGEEKVTAFRAGGFGANNDTLKALLANGVGIDSSYNFTAISKNCEIDLQQRLFDLTEIYGIYEYPMTCYIDYPKHYRHLQICACSFEEMREVLDIAEREGYNSVVILSHSFELLTRNRVKPDKMLIRRFELLCEYLAEHRDRFRVTGFRDLSPSLTGKSALPISTKLLSTIRRYYEQHTINKYNKMVSKTAE